MIRKLLARPYRCLCDLRTVLRLLPQLHRLITKDPRNRSYFPQAEHKSRARIYWDNLLWLLRHGEINDYYYAYGFDCRPCVRMEDFLPYPEFRRIRDRLNLHARLGGYDANYSCLLKDKFVFSVVADSLGFATPRVLALLENGRVFWPADQGTDGLNALLAEPGRDLFFKDLTGERAHGVYAVRTEGDAVLIRGKRHSHAEFAGLLRGKFLAQERIAQHPVLNVLYPLAVNTIRLVTMRTPHGVQPFSACLRVGAHGNPYDNLAAGGLVGPVDLTTGRCGPEFRTKCGYDGRATHHPDTGIPFADFQIPFIADAVREAVRLHRCLYGLHSIGWDIAITPDGPCFIEGNDNWEIQCQQLAEGGLRRRFQEMIASGARPAPAPRRSVPAAP